MNKYIHEMKGETSMKTKLIIIMGCLLILAGMVGVDDAFAVHPTSTRDLPLSYKMFCGVGT